MPIAGPRLHPWWLQTRPGRYGQWAFRLSNVGRHRPCQGAARSQLPAAALRDRRHRAKEEVVS